MVIHRITRGARTNKSIFRKAAVNPQIKKYELRPLGKGKRKAWKSSTAAANKAWIWGQVFALSSYAWKQWMIMAFAKRSILRQKGGRGKGALSITVRQGVLAQGSISLQKEMLQHHPSPLQFPNNVGQSINTTLQGRHNLCINPIRNLTQKLLKLKCTLRHAKHVSPNSEKSLQHKAQSPTTFIAL